MERSRASTNQVEDAASAGGVLRKKGLKLRQSGTYRVAASAAITGQYLQPSVLLCLPEGEERATVARTLSLLGQSHVIELDPCRIDWSKWGPAEIDIAVLHASCLSPSCAALVHEPAFGYPELVFAVEDNRPAQRLALLSRGYRHVVSVDALADWLHDQLEPLSALAQARRIVLGACAVPMQVADLSLGTSAGGSMNLHLAETHFRETYLRALLLEQGSRRRAAEAAGVPYRSFCEMLRKLGI